MTSLEASAVGARTATHDVVLNRLVWLAVALLPITGLAGIGAFGELKGSATVYVLAVAILVASFTTLPSGVVIPRPLLVLLACLLSWLVVTTAINFEGILTSVYHGRSGFNKFATSSAVLVFGFASAIICVTPFRRVSDVEKLFVRPLVIAVLACAVFAVPEILSWFSSAGELLYKFSTGLLHTADSEQGRAPGRLISLAFEAPDLSYFAGFACPWMLLAYRLRANGRPLQSVPIVAALPLLLCLITLLLSNSRTGLLMLGGLILAEFIYWVGLRGLRLGVLALVAVIPVFAAVVLVPWLTLHNVDATLNADDVSTTSRLALFSAQASIFAINPVFGVGFGQFGFHAGAVLPSWAWDSYEVLNWFEMFDELPPTFNVAGRLGAELGLPGLVIWYGFWMMAIIWIARAAPQLPRRSSLNFLNAALFGSIFSLVLGGMSNDPFRRPETWLLIAITALHAGRTSERST
ncbi:O-antigen ligase family protein [Rhodoplanes sp. Z2-YC6860]|uniref:O-antigen ligase family protein n=1 Tax=Rhodoplanes sp. Z2-YC6860 TaxID=674703 RepID=UPI00078CA6CB|nr:O-antigen ligase family protein [Rhodoplanes sp. Z2-YC6860]AMN43649.1 O-antigen polymerase [Rhodoplanes sp. Z2-YC6860]